jgi:predicted PurR-regulated permease PerM
MPTNSQWTRARDAGLAVLAWIAVVYVVFLALGHVAAALLLLVMGALLAYVLTPLVGLLARWIPRWLAIVLVYLALLALFGTLGYFMVSTSVSQLQGLTTALPDLLAQPGPSNHSPIYIFLHDLGIPDETLITGRQDILTWLQGAAGSLAGQAVPIITGVAGTVLNIVLAVVVSIYLVADGPRLVRWLRLGAPSTLRSRIHFTLSILDRNVGGYVRGQLFLCGLVGVLVGVGMWVLHVPYALLLGVLAFILEFIPIIGVFISGALCVLVALSQGWLLAVIVLAYFIVIHVIEGDVVGPRVIGRVLGLHPVVAIVALIAGADLFGFWGALFAAPVAGLIQAVVIALWTQWREEHPEQFRKPPTSDTSLLESPAHPAATPMAVAPVEPGE